MDGIIYFVLILLNFLLFKNINFISQKLNFFDIPNKRKIHKIKVSKIGGIILYVNFLFYLASVYFFKNEILNLPLLFFLSILFFISLINDKHDIRPIYRLIIFYLVFLIWLFFDENLILRDLYFQFIDFNIHLGGYGIFITPLFFVIFINALNLFDGVNLQSISYIFLFFIFFHLNDIDLKNYLYLLIFIYFFSIYNFKNKIFLGDSGITIFAIIITYLTINNYNHVKSSLNCEEIFAMMFLPGVDMLRLYFYRIYKNQNPFSPDQNHLHHYILKIISPKFAFLYQFIIKLLVLIFIYFTDFNFFFTISFLIIIYSATILWIYDKKSIPKNI